jgi:transglutaminase-like putative cysteine protease
MRATVSSALRTSSADGVLAAVTGTVAVGVMLTALPLRSVFTDWGWFTTSIACALPYWLIVAALRSRAVPCWWHSLVGLVGSLVMLLWIFVPQHLGFGVLPNPTALADIRVLIDGANDQLKAGHAPLASTHQLRLLTASALVLLAILTDVLGVLMRRPLLAAAPLLEVLAVASATSSSPAHPVWFAGAAIGFLLILISGTRLQDRAWGPSVDGSAGRLGGARRMATTGIVAALLVPVVLPSVSVNLLARAAHHDGGGSGGDGAGSGQIELKNLASLRGSLTRSTPAELFRVQGDPNARSFYIRQATLDLFDNNRGWIPSDGRFGRGERLSVADETFPIVPGAGVGTGNPINLRFTISSLGGSDLPILANPITIDNANRGVWDARTATVGQESLRRGMSYTVSAIQPAPSVEQLRSATKWAGSTDAGINDQYTKLPGMPASVTQLAQRLTSGLGPYEAARAISDYFTNGKNGFKYSTDAPEGDGRAPLVTFLDKKSGFCQQYAAAAAVLMRLVGLPSRVVLGYTHKAPDARGEFTVMTSDAHAWVEVYLESIGWVPFDPTPFSGADAGRAIGLPYAPHLVDGATGTAEVTAPSTTNSHRNPEIDNPTDAVALPPGSPSVSDRILSVPVLGATIGFLLLMLIAGPRFLRSRQRRRRLATARTTGSPEPLWLELAASATDQGSLWPTTITVGQVPNWLRRQGLDERGQAAVTAVAERVELERFSEHGSSRLTEHFIAGLDGALTRWGRRAERRQRLLNRWLPRSLIARQTTWRR